MLRPFPAQRPRPPAAQGRRRLPAELRWLHDRRSIDEARRDLSAWIAKWGARYSKLVAWVEETTEETLNFYRLPLQHHTGHEASQLARDLRQKTTHCRAGPNPHALPVLSLATTTALSRIVVTQ
jgi:transposase-like protein